MPNEPKKFAILRILEILQERTDEDHLLTQSEISSILKSQYGINLERKAIAEDIKLLEDEYDIFQTPKGIYCASNIFEKSEIRVLIDSVLCSRYINPKHSDDLIKKLVKFGGLNYKSHVKHIYSINEWEKTENQAVLLNIEIIDEAIEKNKQILIKYGKYDLKNKLVSKYSQKVSPYLMLLHNQRYYLMGYNNYYKEMTFLRIDKMIDIKILDDNLTPYKDISENGSDKIDYKDLAVARPYMFSDKSCDITLKCKKDYYDSIVDWFGFSKFVKDVEDGYIEVIIKSSPKAMCYWALQYGDICEVISPDSVRNKIIEKIKEVNKTYNL